MKKPVVFIMHGFLQSSESWAIRHDAEHSLPFILADQGCVPGLICIFQQPIPVISSPMTII